MGAGKKAQWPKEKAYVMWAAGKTGSEIAAALGVSRNAVMGAIHRAGLKRSALKPKRKKPSPRPRLRAKVLEKTSVDVAVAPIKTYGRRDYIFEIDRPKSAGFPITDLGKRQCRFAVSPDSAGKDSHYFCGKKCDEGEVYCRYHKKMIGRGHGNGQKSLVSFVMAIVARE
jgi:GcrA cell cycle regulator